MSLKFDFQYRKSKKAKWFKFDRNQLNDTYQCVTIEHGVIFRPNLKVISTKDYSMP